MAYRWGDWGFEVKFGAPEGKTGLGIHAQVDSFEKSDVPGKEIKRSTYVGAYAESEHARAVLAHLSSDDNYQDRLVDIKDDKKSDKKTDTTPDEPTPAAEPA